MKKPLIKIAATLAAAAMLLCAGNAYAETAGTTNADQATGQISNGGGVS